VEQHTQLLLEQAELVEQMETMVSMLEDLIQCLVEQILQTSLQMVVAEEHIIPKVKLVVLVAELVITMDKQVQELQTKVLTEEDALKITVTVEAAEALAKTELQEIIILAETVVMVYHLQLQGVQLQDLAEELEDHIEQTQEV
tara:strand:+ start:28 stop:456 length:429 start_codon:yes stop_codon:yes gene_type:complete